MKQIWSNGENDDHAVRDLCDGKIHWRQWKENGEWIERRYRERCMTWVHPSKKFITLYTDQKAEIKGA